MILPSASLSALLTHAGMARADRNQEPYQGQQEIDLNMLSVTCFYKLRPTKDDQGRRQMTMITRVNWCYFCHK